MHVVSIYRITEDCVSNRNLDFFFIFFFSKSRGSTRVFIINSEIYLCVRTQKL